ncbi:hypothetical protein SDC9_04420 [bioreactor metagenome]|uniref:Uncharacterized protein n=1 Tax=bioreactor metagenome TaxID=1076179 RepID=A0A644SW73_9ZZZZ
MASLAPLPGPAAFDEPLDEETGDGTGGRYFGQLVDAIPAQMVDLGPVGSRIPRFVIRFEGEHEGVGKRPRLGSDVAGRMDFDARLLHHLPPYRLFQGFARIDESGYQAMPSFGHFGVVRQEYFLALTNQDDHRRRNTGKIHPGAGGTNPRPGVLEVSALHQGGAAERTMPRLVRPVGEGLGFEREGRRAPGD